MLSTSNKLAILTLSAAFAVSAQETTLDPASSVKIDLPADSPLSLVSTNMGDSRANNRGGAMVLDLHMSLTLKNSGFRRVRGVVLLITAQEFAPGGKGSVSRPCIDVPPTQEFTIPVDIRLVRPVQQSGGQLVRVQLDGVIFDDLSFFGPNKLNSRRAMTFWETEAQRDRAYFKRVLSAKGDKGLRDEMLLSMNRQSERPQLDVALAKTGRTTGSAQPVAERTAQFAFLKLPNSPVQPLEGHAEISGNEARAPQIDIVNQSGKPVRYVELGWLVKDKDGKEFLAASVPGSAANVSIPSGQRTRLQPETSLKFSRTGKPVEIAAMTGFVSQVEFTDGKVWVPSREDLGHDLRVVAPSPEEQRLTDIYSKKGLTALLAELNRY
jgi:hypothetical protein